jgi:hypothetical protein
MRRQNKEDERDKGAGWDLQLGGGEDFIKEELQLLVRIVDAARGVSSGGSI